MKGLFGRKTAAMSLGVLAAASVALACMGADGALDLMKGRAAVGTAGAFAVFCLVRAVMDAFAGRGIKAFLKPAFFLHLGFALVLGGWIGNELVNEPELNVRLFRGVWEPVGTAFDLRLRDFSIDRWEDTGTVRQYTSRCEVWDQGKVPDTPDHSPERVEVSVNHPLVRGGWWVYQSSYQELTNPHIGAPVTLPILLCVRDAGLPYVTAGAFLILIGAFLYAGASLKRDDTGQAPPRRLHPAVRGLYGLVFAGVLAMLVHRGLATGHPPMQNLYEFLMCAAALIPVLTCVSARVDRQNTLRVDAFLLALVMIPVGFVMDGRVKHLMPALQSPFFVPHVGSYVLGYILLVRAALGAGKRLVGVGFFLLTVGLVLGAAWGKVCWGHWWQFDPKEMWSLATWFVYAAYFHLKPTLSPQARRAFLIAGAAMIVLTLTWINLSRLFSGMHSYA